MSRRVQSVVGLFGPLLMLATVAGAQFEWEPEIFSRDNDCLRLWAVRGYHYTVQRSSNLVDWQPYGHTIDGRGGEEYVVLAPMGDEPAYFRLRYQTPPYTSDYPPSPGVEVYHYPEPEPALHRTYRVAILLVNTAGPLIDDPVSAQREFYTPRELGDLYFRHPHGVNSFYKEASYGKVQFSGTVIGWIYEGEQDLDDQDILNNSDYYFGLFNEYIRYSEYDVFVLHVLVKGRGANIGWLYPHQSINTPQGRIMDIGINWLIGTSVHDYAPLDYSNWSGGDGILPDTTWAHEMLHTLGVFGHANSYDCGTNVISVTSSSNPIKGYGNSFSLMGEHAYSMHPDVLMKQDAGWLEPDQVQEVAAPGIYAVYPLETADGRVKGLRIALPTPVTNSAHEAVFDHLVIEYRTATGFDRYLERLDGSTFLRWYKPEGEVDRNGVLVYLEYQSADTEATVLLDMNPTTSYDPDASIKWPGNPGKFADAILATNQTYVYLNEVSIRPIGVRADGGMDVEILFP